MFSNTAPRAVQVYRISVRIALVWFIRYNGIDKTSQEHT